MSWYLFRDAPAIKQRGIKVDGFLQAPLHRPTINLSWGMNEKTAQRNPPHIIPSTLNAKPPSSNTNQPRSSVKVLTETSEDEEEELTKLIKRREDRRREEGTENYAKMKLRSQSLANAQPVQNHNNNEDFTKRIRYLENSLLPNYRRDSIASILDCSLNKESLSDSRVSNRSNKKNESSVVLGDGFNPFAPSPQVKKDLTLQLQEMYDYEEQRRRRVSAGSFALG